MGRRAGRASRATATAVGVVLALVALSACAKGEDPQIRAGTREDALAFLQQSADKSLAANTFLYTTRFVMTGENLVASPCGGDANTLRGRVDLNAGVTEVDADGDGTVDSVATDRAPYVGYLRSSAFEGADIPTPWVSVMPKHMLVTLGLPAADALFPGSSAPLGILGSPDPSQFLDQVLGAASSVTELGVEDVEGRPTRHLQTVLEGHKVGELSAERMKELEPLFQELFGGMGGGSTGTTQDLRPRQTEEPSASVDAWIDDQQLVRRVVLRAEWTDAGDDRMFLEVTTEYTAYGEPMQVGVPPADQVTPIGGLRAADVVGLLPPLPTCMPSGVDGPSPEATAEAQRCLDEARRREIGDVTVDEYLTRPASTTVGAIASAWFPPSAAGFECFDDMTPPSCPPEGPTETSSTAPQPCMPTPPNTPELTAEMRACLDDMMKARPTITTGGPPPTFDLPPSCLAAMCAEGTGTDPALASICESGSLAPPPLPDAPPPSPDTTAPPEP